MRRTHSHSHPAPSSTPPPPPQQHAPPPPNAPQDRKNKESPEETGHGERDEQGEITGQGRPRSPKTVQSSFLFRGGGRSVETFLLALFVRRSDAANLSSISLTSAFNFSVSCSSSSLFRVFFSTSFCHDFTFLSREAFISAFCFSFSSNLSSKLFDGVKGSEGEHTVH